jgi:hypothetical protein
MLQDFLTGRTALDSTSTTPALAASRPGQFQPFSTTRGTDLASLGAPGRLPSASESERREAPQVELVEEEGKVRRIVVTCTCCEKIEIECEY